MQHLVHPRAFFQIFDTIPTTQYILQHLVHHRVFCHINDKVKHHATSCASQILFSQPKVELRYGQFYYLTERNNFSCNIIAITSNVHLYICTCIRDHNLFTFLINHLSQESTLSSISQESTFSSINFLINQLSHQSTFSSINFCHILSQIYSSTTTFTQFRRFDLISITSSLSRVSWTTFLLSARMN